MSSMQINACLCQASTYTLTEHIHIAFNASKQETSNLQPPQRDLSRRNKELDNENTSEYIGVDDIQDQLEHIQTNKNITLVYPNPLTFYAKLKK